MTDLKLKDKMSIMKIKPLTKIIITILLGLSSSFAADLMDSSYISINSRLSLDSYTHKLGNNWTSSKGGYKGINYYYTYSDTTPVSNSWETSYGQTLYLDVGLKSEKNFTGDLGFEVINKYADRYWLPVNFENRLHADDKNFAWTRANITYNDDWWTLQYYRNIGHYHWGDKGDLFNLYPEQNETEKYLRVSGRPAPEGYKLNMTGGLGDLELVYAPEGTWDYRNGVYANYRFYIGGVAYNIIHRDHIIPYGTPDERLKTTELSTTFDIYNHTFQAGILYQPFRLNKEYEYVEEVAPGTGLLGSKYLKQIGITKESDAYGASTKLILRPYSLFDEITLQYTYLGLVAGNKQEFNSQFSKKFSKFSNGCIEYTYRKPLLGPIPLIFEGTDSNRGPAIFEPRGPNSPFWVGWENYSYWKNREASIISLVYSYDPTPTTWFYKYFPNILEEYNINPLEDAPVSFAARYTLTRYPSGTDRLTYLDPNGNTFWEPPLNNSPWPTDGYIGSIKTYTNFVLGDWKLLLEIEAGESLAYSGFAYTTSTAKEKPITGYLISGLSITKGLYKTKLKYSQDYWGPEDWHRVFGQTFDNLYQVSFSKTFNESFNAGIEYTGAREIDKQYFTSELGDYDEFRIYCTISFGPIINYFGPVIKPVKHLRGKEPEKDLSGPQASISISTTTFYPQQEKLIFQPYALDIAGVKNWKISILDWNEKVVKEFFGNGQPPTAIEWDGKDDIYNTLIHEGKYKVELSAADMLDNTSKSDFVSFDVINPPQIIIKEIIKEITKEVKVTETEKNLLVSITSSMLFDTGQSNIKPSGYNALNEIIKILDTYKQNKIAVEGHTDSIGSNEINKKLSEKRAQSVADYLITAGILAERITVTGCGKDKPVASNSTALGREANRRVEVIIFK